eukprot:2178796-Karenia_brevis.AAC.1
MAQQDDSTCPRPQSRRHFCDPVLKQSKDPEYADAVYERVLRPGRWRTCNDSEKPQELFACKVCEKMLPKAKYTDERWRHRVRQKPSCIDCKPPGIEPTVQCK